MSKTNYTVFPRSRVKNILQSCIDGKMERAVPEAVAKALELFSKDLCLQTSDIAREANNKIIQDFHLKRCVERNDRYSFLGGIVSGIVDIHASDQRHHANRAIRNPTEKQDDENESEKEQEMETEDDESQSEDEDEDAKADKIQAAKRGRRSSTANIKPRIIFKFRGNQQPGEASAGLAGCRPAAAENTSNTLGKRKITNVDSPRTHSDDDEYSTESDEDVKRIKLIRQLHYSHLGRNGDDKANAGESSAKINVKRQKAKSIADDKQANKKPMSRRPPKPVTTTLSKPRTKKRKSIQSLQENELDIRDAEVSAKQEHESERAATNPQPSTRATVSGADVPPNYDVQQPSINHLEMNYAPVTSHLAKNICADEDDYDDYLEEAMN